MMSKKRARELLNLVLETYPNAQPTLNAETPFQRVVAVMLSAQTTDLAVNAVTPALFRDYPTPELMAQATPEELEPYIDRLGLYRTKAKHLQELSALLDEEYDGVVPREKSDLMRLPGVGNKTATVVRSDSFDLPGVAVDTHITRITKGFHMVKQSATPDEIQAYLESLMPPETWTRLHRALIHLGREWLTARNPEFPDTPQWQSFKDEYRPRAKRR